MKNTGGGEDEVSPGWVPGLRMLWGHVGHMVSILFLLEAHAGLSPGL